MTLNWTHFISSHHTTSLSPAVNKNYGDADQTCQQNQYSKYPVIDPVVLPNFNNNYQRKIYNCVFSCLVIKNWIKGIMFMANLRQP